MADPTLQLSAPVSGLPVLGLIGKGQMGQLVEKLWLNESKGAVLSVHQGSSCASWEKLEGADILIDVSAASATERVCKLACKAKIPWVLGTTNWQNHKEMMQREIHRAQIPFLYAPNFSLGIHLLSHALKAVSPLLSLLPTCEVSIREVHHKKKRDQPSGTAKWLHRELEPLAEHRNSSIYSERRGAVIGRHEILIDAHGEEIALIHKTSHRESLARGAMRAADWLMRQPPGWYEMEDLVRELIALAHANTSVGGKP